MSAPHQIRKPEIDWQSALAGLDQRGFALLPRVLAQKLCQEITGYYADDHRFRSRIDMSRYSFDQGEYKYFEYPLPGIVQQLRVPLTLLTLANLIAAWLDRSIPRKWWLGTAAIVLLERLATFSYFIPAMVSLTTSELPDQQVNARLSQWLFFNRGRPILTLTGWLMALKALSLPASTAPDVP
jgi:hypothetical protein